MYIFSPASFFHIYICTCYYSITICFCWRFFPVRGSNSRPLEGCVVFSSYAWRCRIRAVLSSSIATIRAPAANFGLLAPLLANHLGSQDNQHEYISLHALNPLCPGLEPATAPLALAEVCVIRVNWACNPLAL